MNASRFFILIAILLCAKNHAYNEPTVNLGLSSFLDGGPLRPEPGWYAQALINYYHSDKLLDGSGDLLIKPSPHFNDWALVTQAIYQTNVAIIPHTMLGFSASLPFDLSSHLSRNKLNIKDSGGGVGNLGLGVYLQWRPVFHNGRAIFVHRLEFDAYFPTGKNKQPEFEVNPASKFYYIDPYWAATLYLTERWATSWRLYYLWNARNQRTNIQAGPAFHMNLTTEFEVVNKLWIGLNSYYFKQLKNSNLCGKCIPDSKEQVFGIGPGLLYFLPRQFAFFFNLYWETAVRNRPQGFSLVLRLFKQF